MPPRVPIPYVREQFDRSHSVRRLSELNRRSADAAAELELRQGDISANLGMTLANLAGNVGSAIVEAPGRQRQAEAEQMRLDEARAASQARSDERGRESAIRDVTRKVRPTESGQTDWKRIAEEVRSIDPIAALDYFKVASAEQQASLAAEKQKTDGLARMLMTFEADSKKLAPPARQAMYGALREQAVQGGLAKPEDIPESYSPAFISRMRSVIEPLDSLFKRMEAAGGDGFTLSPGQQRFGPEGGEPIASVAEKAVPPAPFSLAPGAKRFGPDGQVIAEVAPLPREPRAPTAAEPLENVIGPDGKAILVPRSQAPGMTRASGANKPASGLEKRALNFFNRARQADTDLETMEAEIQQMGLAGQTAMAVLPNFLQTETGQQYTQAQRAFTEARLRKDSGAAIPEQEFKNDRQTYFAQPGDTQTTLEQKRRARGAVLASLGFESGQALSEFEGDPDASRALVDGYKARSARPGSGEPLKPGTTVTVPARAPASPGAGPITVTTPDGQTFTFPNKAAADGFKKRAGIP